MTAPVPPDANGLREAVLSELGICPFKENVGDASMCVCGLPAINHDTFAEQIVLSDHPAIGRLLAASEAAPTAGECTHEPEHVTSAGLRWPLVCDVCTPATPPADAATCEHGQTVADLCAALRAAEDDADAAATWARAEGAAEAWDEGYEAAIGDTEARSAPPGPCGPVDPTSNPYARSDAAPHTGGES